MFRPVPSECRTKATVLAALLLASILWPASEAPAQTVAETTPAMDPLPQAPLVLAVLPFEAGGEDVEEIAEQVPDLLTAYLSAEPSLMLVERAQLDAVLSEMELGMSGTVDPASAAQVGRLTGAQLLVTGKSIPVQRNVVVVAKIIGVETGRVIGETISFSARGSVLEAVQELAAKMAVKINSQGAVLVPEREPEESLIARLRPLVEGRSLPSVSVSIPEISLNQAVLDPAAETELSEILLGLGFVLIDPLATNRSPDVRVTGEAFSEFGIRKGNLVSSKGSVELKAIHRQAGKVLLVSREVSVAVDIAPEMAGKAALAHSAAKLAERLVPVLADLSVE
jgi:TolB-like protein